MGIAWKREHVCFPAQQADDDTVVEISGQEHTERGSHTPNLVCVCVGETTGAGAGFVSVCFAGLRGCRTLQRSVGSESF